MVSSNSKFRDLARRIREHALMMTSLGNSSHIGSILSIADLLAVLYGGFLKVDPSDPQSPERDRFILSKGHAGAGVYAVLAESGFFDVERLKTHYQNGSVLSGHVSHKGIPGVEISTGSLGQGLAIACGITLRGQLNKQSYRTVCLLSDGECNEGSNWEAFLFAAHHKLKDLTVIVDCNGLQSLRSTSETLDLEPLGKKMEAFNFQVIPIDGHDLSAIHEALNIVVDKPKIILANTIKGKGVSFMENSVLWHYRSPNEDELSAALLEVRS